MSTLLTILLQLSITQAKDNAERPASRVPEVLRQAMLNRTFFHTARFNCRLEVDRNGWAPKIRNYEVSWGGTAFKLRDLGDDEGVTRFLDAESGEAALGLRGACTPEDRVVDFRNGEVWAHKSNSPFVGKSSIDRTPDCMDTRTVGLRAVSIQRKDVHGLLKMLEDDREMRFKVTLLKAGFVQVIATGELHQDKSFFEYEWEIDTEKGPEIVLARETLVAGDGSRSLFSEMKVILGFFDGRWWPVEVEGSSPLTRIRVKYDGIEFNRPSHEANISPDSMGIPVGAEVVIPGDPGRNYYLGGGVTVDRSTWEATKGQYDLRPLQAFHAQMRSGSAGDYPVWWNEPSTSLGLEAASNRPDLWEAYVRRWVLKHTNHHTWRVNEPLTDAQKTGAKSILADCRSRAVPIRAKLDNERMRVLAQLVELEKSNVFLATSAPSSYSGSDRKSDTSNSASSPPKPADRDEKEKRIAVLRARAAALEKSPEIERLFDELKRRIESLLTSRQADPNSGRIERPNPPPPPVVRGPAPGRPATPTSRPVAPGR